MKTLRLLGTIMAMASIATAAVLSLYGVNMAVRSNRALAWTAVAICVAWFVSLTIRSYSKRCNNA